MVLPPLDVDAEVAVDVRDVDHEVVFGAEPVGQEISRLADLVERTLPLDREEVLGHLDRRLA